MEKLMPRVKHGRYILLPTTRADARSRHAFAAGDLGQASRRIPEASSTPADRNSRSRRLRPQRRHWDQAGRSGIPMSDRKYRQRGYQDENKPRGPKGPAAPRPPKQDRAPGTSAAGRRRTEDAEPDGGARGLPLRAAAATCCRCRSPATAAARSAASICTAACNACRSTPAPAGSARRATKLPARVAPKDARNDCTLVPPRTTIERQTSTPQNRDAGSSSSGSSNSARQALRRSVQVGADSVPRPRSAPVHRMFQSVGLDIIRYPPRESLQWQLMRLFQQLDINCVLDVGANHGQYAGLAARVGLSWRHRVVRAGARSVRVAAKDDGRGRALARLIPGRSARPTTSSRSTSLGAMPGPVRF